MPKPTKEEMQGSKELEQFNAALESLGIRPKDPKHPLAEFPPERLKSAVITTLGMPDVAWFKSFVEWFFEAYGYPITGRQVGAWLSNSKTMPAIQVARVADLVARAFVDALADGQLELISQDMVMLDANGDICDPYSPDMLEFFYNEFVKGLFSISSLTGDKIKRLALIADVLAMDEGELDALASVAGLAGYTSGKLAGNGCADMGLENSARFVSELLERTDVSSECDELASWAKEWTETVNRPEPLDLPF